MHAYQFIFLLVAALLENSFAQIDDYYWREYNGTIPADAVPGGTDNKGETTYIGTGYYEQNNAILPSTIYKDDGAVHSHLGPYYLRSRVHTQILCAPLSKRPIWKQVNLDRIDDYKHCNFIKGGYESGANLLIGKTQIGGRTYTGKVYPAYHKWAGLEVWTSEHVGAIRNFEMLGYCSLETSTIHAFKVPIECVSCLV